MDWKDKPNAIKFFYTRKYWGDCLNFLFDSSLGISLWQRYILLKRLYAITFANDNIPHSQQQILVFVRAILRAPRNNDGVVIEAGCFKGISSAKFSIAAALAGKTFIVCDSFEGLPDNDEPHDKGIYGRPLIFNEGDYAASLEDVRASISSFGEPDVCEFIKGWFDETLPGFSRPISAVYLDVDLVSSTKTCLKYFWPMLESGGVIYSQDGHIPLVIDLFSDEKFWCDEMGCAMPPKVKQLGETLLLEVTKP
jgi:O-methyltransferase